MTLKLPSALELTLPAALVGGSTRSHDDVQADVLALFDECAPGLRRYVVSFGLSTEAADDVVQEVFLSLFKHLCLGRSRSNLKGWIFQVGHNHALKQRQRHARAQQIDGGWLGDLADALVDPADNPEERVAGDQRRRRLQSVVRALPEQDRQCLYLRAEGLRYREIARTLGVSLGSVAKSVTRAVARLSRADIG